MTAQGAIDIWVNLMTGEQLEKYDASILQEMKSLYNEPELYSLAKRDPSEFIDWMDQRGIRTALVPSMRLGAYQSDENPVTVADEAVRNLCNDYGNRFFGLTGIDPYEGMDGVYRLRRTVEEFGFIGAHIVPYGFRIPPNHRRFYPFYATCVELDIPVLIQIGHTGVQLPNDPGHPRHLDDVALEFPDLNIIATNIGWPWTDEAIALSWTHDNIYLGLTGHAPQYWDDELINFVRSLGDESVMWGTSYPFVDLDQSMNGIDDLNFTAEVERRLLYENAERVFSV